MKMSWWVGRLWAAGWIVCAMMLTGCGDDDDDQEEVQTVVVTNKVDGTVVTNVVVVPTPSNDTNSNAGAVAPAAWTVTGNWTGTHTLLASGTTTHMEFDLHQNGKTITGQFAVGSGANPAVGNLTGELIGNQMSLTIKYDLLGMGKLNLNLFGQVTDNGTVWKGRSRDISQPLVAFAGTFAFQKSR